MSQRTVNHWLIHHAARHAPEILAERLEEEWLRSSGKDLKSVASALCHRLLLGDPGNRVGASAVKGRGSEYDRGGLGCGGLCGSELQLHLA